MRQQHRKNQGFTLIELSIVLTIIGLIIGGVLVGQEMIGAAATRATISQVEKYNTAANTFYTKYGYLPGDIPDPYASQFGFAARGTGPAEGDGNGVIQGDNSFTAYGYEEMSGETVMFWVDLTVANMVEGGFNTATSSPGTSSSTAISSYLPAAKIGNGNYVYVWSGGYGPNPASSDGKNYFGISAVTTLQQVGGIASAPALTVQQAYNIDKKIDDGLPQSGSVTAQFLGSDYSGDGNTPQWAGGNNAHGACGALYQPTTAATPGSATTCYDNGSSAGATQQYSTKQSGGVGLNCALSFRMQGAAR